VTQDLWLTRHPYLRPIADFHAQVARAATDIPIPCAGIPDWNNYIGDYRKGIPLLRSSHTAVDLQPAEHLLVSLVEKLHSQPMHGQFATENRDLGDQLRCEVDVPHRAIGWLLGNDDFKPAHPGLLRYLGWTAVACYLCPVVDVFGKWRDEERWLRPYCPTCGSSPSMAQLTGVDPARRRLLSCGCCSTRWQFRRIGCPFCETGDEHQLPSLTIEGENTLRIDYCRSCGAYLKTYIGDGSETWLLEDWSSLHLDVIAEDRGLNRTAASLYEL
jgi:FdhE protein